MDVLTIKNNQIMKRAVQIHRKPLVSAIVSGDSWLFCNVLRRSGFVIELVAMDAMEQDCDWDNALTTCISDLITVRQYFIHCLGSLNARNRIMFGYFFHSLS